MLEKTNWFYQAIEEIGSDPVLGQYHTYGLQAMYKTSEECELIEEVHDVTTDEMFATKLAILFNFYQLSPLHLKDVLIDMIP